uniref:Uncharacterized protein n=1 Tax=Lepeophtheirus salmonis TaxID=72036 RepID=A0A0K2VAY6_LEPSM
MFQIIKDMLKSNGVRYFSLNYSISTITHITTAIHHFLRSECLFSVCLTNLSSQVKILVISMFSFSMPYVYSKGGKENNYNAQI